MVNQQNSIVIKKEKKNKKNYNKIPVNFFWKGKILLNVDHITSLNQL